MLRLYRCRRGRGFKNFRRGNGLRLRGNGRSSGSAANIAARHAGFKFACSSCKIHEEKTEAVVIDNHIKHGVITGKLVDVLIGAQRQRRHVAGSGRELFAGFARNTQRNVIGVACHEDVLTEIDAEGFNPILCAFEAQDETVIELALHDAVGGRCAVADDPGFSRVKLRFRFFQRRGLCLHRDCGQDCCCE